MPVEINELIIRANVTTGQNPPQQVSPANNEDNHKMQQLLDDVLKKLTDKDER